ncbi:hypothetical protein BGZ61DRAFT_223892 [Ilyonectria robusta]|uniref:uncharacterized protein n=1 Tax=Ilyonectria robusta TaxID=1079257 RepID=UPI001E8CC7AF|nr:uncharacterized protein BGZ61DRAFT_223892 [Ilyonectria robusta]KAH8706576.1 hypothetical protein BGZ61DRAFT_223892 [Ilyonectria robusta]
MANTGRFFTSRVTNTSQIYKGAQNRDTRGWFRNRARPTACPQLSLLGRFEGLIVWQLAPSRQQSQMHWRASAPLHHQQGSFAWLIGFGRGFTTWIIPSTIFRG